MITPAQRAEIRRLYFGEHWKVDTIATALGVHHQTVRRAIELDTRPLRRARRASTLDPFLPFIRDTLAQYPRLRATRLHEMLRQRGYPGSARQVRRLVRHLRPTVPARVYRRVVTLAAEQAQVDWGRLARSRLAAVSARCRASSWCSVTRARSLRSSRWTNAREFSARPCRRLRGLRRQCADAGL